MSLGQDGQNAEVAEAGSRPNLRFETAEELFAQIPEIAEDLTARPNGSGQDPIAFIEALLASPVPEEAVTFAAYVLPRRHSVWWGHECLRHVAAMLSETDQEMLALAAAWVGEPNEDTRYAALDAAMEAPVKSPGVWIAMGAGWSGGSMVPKDYQPVAPPPFLTARAVNGGILSILALTDRKQRPARLTEFVQMALQIARGG